MTTNPFPSKEHAVLHSAFTSWMSCGALRSKRRRAKEFTYGNQWGDPVCRVGDHVLPSSREQSQSEWEYYHSRGGTPITNNLLRQLVRSVVGRYRSDYLSKERFTSAALRETSERNQLAELDSRAFEEFLISGCCIQRIDVERELLDASVAVRNVNANSFFMNAVVDPLLRDCEIIGQLHDMSLARLVGRLSGGSRRKASWLRSVYADADSDSTLSFATSLGADGLVSRDFWQSSVAGKCRAIEVWTLESREVTLWHDPERAEVSITEAPAREASGDGSPSRLWDIAMVWHCRWFSPTGVLLAEWDSPYAHGGHPFAVKLYPLTDGEVHSFVEDVIDQQKYVNRLITLIDHIMLSSAKGVLLYPETSLPTGYTWEDVKKIWSNCNGLLPYDDRNSDKLPQQITTNNTNIGAYEMVQLQMRLFDNISGVSGALQGRSATGVNSVRLYESEVQNSAAALADIFETFNNFRKNRDEKILGL